jgi:hypothetical protein
VAALLPRLRQIVWPIGPGSRPRQRDLRRLVTLLVALVVIRFAPDFAAGLELATVVDALGASLFLFSIALGFRLLLGNILRWVLHLVVGPNNLLIACAPAPAPVRAYGLALATYRLVFVAAIACASYHTGAELIR